MQPGTVLRDKYQLVATIGRGGMGEVFHAVHLPSGTDVAVKVVNRDIVDDTMMARLEREAAAATRIASPYVPRLLDIDRLETRELFLVMELLQGETLSERLKRGGVLSWEEVFHIGDNVLRGLIDAHEAGVVHRDLKPGNIFIEHLDDGMARARILDFGVCKLDEQDTKKLTITGESVGTIAYMAPEQIRGASKVDERADLYSFAMIVYEAVCGRIPYEAQGQMALLATKLERAARPLKGHNMVPVPSGLDGLINRALSRKPNDRPANGREMLRAWQALGPASSQAAIQSPTLPSGPGASQPPTQVVVTAGVRSTLSGTRRRPAVAVAIGVGLAAVIAVTAFSRRSPSQPSADTADKEGPVATATAEESAAAAPPSAPPPSAQNAPTEANVAAPPATGPVPMAPLVATVVPSPIPAPPSTEVLELDERSGGVRVRPAPVATPAKPPPVTASRPAAAKTSSPPPASPPAPAPAKPPTPPRERSGGAPTLVEQPRY
jgi:serine/threonine-protein kinase